MSLLGVHFEDSDSETEAVPQQPLIGYYTEPYTGLLNTTPANQIQTAPYRSLLDVHISDSSDGTSEISHSANTSANSSASSSRSDTPDEMATPTKKQKNISFIDDHPLLKKNKTKAQPQPQQQMQRHPQPQRNLQPKPQAQPQPQPQQSPLPMPFFEAMAQLSAENARLREALLQVETDNYKLREQRGYFVGYMRTRGIPVPAFKPAPSYSSLPQTGESATSPKI